MASSASGAAVTMAVASNRGGRAGRWRPTELLMAALGGCIAMDVTRILDGQREPLTGFQVRVTPDERDESLPGRPFKSVLVEHAWTGAVGAQAVGRAVDLAAHRYCTIQLTLETRVRVEHSLLGADPLPSIAPSGATAVERGARCSTEEGA